MDFIGTEVAINISFMPKIVWLISGYAPIKVNIDILKNLVEENPYQTARELGEQFNASYFINTKRCLNFISGSLLS